MVDRKKQKHGMAVAAINPSLDALLEKLRSNGAEKVEDGFMSCMQWADEWKITPSTTRYHCQRMADAGIMEIKSFKVKTGNRSLAAIKHYRIK